MKCIEWKTKALRQLRKIKNMKQQQNIYTQVGKLVDFPQCKNVKKIKSSDMYRLRVGQWRVFFTEDLKIVTIEEVKPRNERTYK